MACPTRLTVGVMLFVSSLSSYVIRVNMSINMLAMVYPANYSTELPDYGERYHWNIDEQSYIYGAFFLGYLITQFPAGILAEWYGGRSVLGYALLLSAITTFLIPQAAGVASFWGVIFLRFLTGCFSGGIPPGMQNVIGKWAPPDEKSKFSVTIIGGTLGTVITWPILGFLLEKFGWAYGFYVSAIFTLIITFIWFMSVYNTPAQHPRISSEEKEYIARQIGDTVSATTKRFPPIVCLLKSSAFWTLLLLDYGNSCAFNGFIIGTPKYMNEILKFDLAKAGIWASLPYLSRVSCGFVFGFTSDYLTKHKIFSVAFVRKSFCVFSHIIPGILLVCIGYVGDNAAACIAIMTIAFGFNGAVSVTNLQNAHDFAPNYTASIFALINSLGTSTGFLSPMVIAHFTRERNTVTEWNQIFLVASICYIVPAIVFILFGVTAIQPWNNVNYHLDRKAKQKLRCAEEMHPSTKHKL